MDAYMFKRNREGIHIINISKTWEKLMLAARIIASIKNPKDVLVSQTRKWPISDFTRSFQAESMPRELF
jgi:small subunit ribosomal protein SAe